MRYHYIVVDFHSGLRLAKVNNEVLAYRIAENIVRRHGTYITVNCYDNSGNSWRKNFVFSGNECNFKGIEV